MSTDSPTPPFAGGDDPTPVASTSNGGGVATLIPSENGHPAASVVLSPRPLNFFSHRDIMSRLRQQLSKTKYRRKRLLTVHERVVAAADDAQEAWVALEAEHIRTDPDELRQGSLPWAAAVALLVAAIDTVPAYWAAQALNHDPNATYIVTAILVVGLTGFAWLMSHFSNRHERRMFGAAFLFTGFLIALETGLRARFLNVVDKAAAFDVALEAGLLAAISGGLVWFGYEKLVKAEPYATYRLRRRAEKLEDHVQAIRRDLVRAAADYRNSWESLRHIESGRVGQPHELVAQVGQELALMDDALVRRARETAESSGPDVRVTSSRANDEVPDENLHSTEPPNGADESA